jgi:hypothetical protein
MNTDARDSSMIDRLALTKCYSTFRAGTVQGEIEDEKVTFEFVLKARRGELKDGSGTWIVQEDGNLKGDFKIRD